MTITRKAGPEDREVRVLAPAPGPPPHRRPRLRRWSGLAREVGIVVAGILIAFSLDAWWDARREKLSQEAQLRHRNIALRSRALLSVLQLHPVGSDVQVPDSLLGSVFEWRTQSWSTGTVEALIASGDLRQIADPELRSLLADWPARVEEVAEDQLLARDFVYAVAIPELARQADVAHLVDPWRKPLSGLTSVRASAEAKAVVAARAAQAELATRSLRVFRDEVDAVLIQLQRHLDRL